jgi:hypothetical protein
MNSRSAAPKRSTGRTAGSGAARAATGAARTQTRPTPHALLARLRTPRRPRLWFEVLLIGASYWLYSQIRNSVPEQHNTALRHADAIWTLEHNLGLAVEHGVNHTLDSVTWLIVGMNYYYATLHFIITIGVLAWLYLSHPARYGPARAVLFCTTWLALVGFYAYPLAPPRLMTGGGFIDTVRTHHTWGSMSQGSMAEVSNQYAAMPSMHVGWSLWCGITLMVLAVPVWAKVLGALYPGATLVVIIATGNHFWMDAVGGVVCLAIGFCAAYAIYGRGVYRMPREPMLELEPVKF